MSATSVLVDFYYRGVRCKERLKMPPTAANKKFASNLRAQIQVEIARGTFDYAKHFPNSKKALLLSRVPGAAVTIGDAMDRWLRGMKGQIEHTTYRDYELAIVNEWTPKYRRRCQSRVRRTVPHACIQ